MRWATTLGDWPLLEFRRERYSTTRQRPKRVSGGRVTRTRARGDRDRELRRRDAILCLCLCVGRYAPHCFRMGVPRTSGECRREVGGLVDRESYHRFAASTRFQMCMTRNRRRCRISLVFFTNPRCVEEVSLSRTCVASLRTNNRGDGTEHRRTDPRVGIRWHNGRDHQYQGSVTSLFRYRPIRYSRWLAACWPPRVRCATEVSAGQCTLKREVVALEHLRITLLTPATSFERAQFSVSQRNRSNSPTQSTQQRQRRSRPRRGSRAAEAACFGFESLRIHVKMCPLVLLGVPFFRVRRSHTAPLSSKPDQNPPVPEPEKPAECKDGIQLDREGSLNA